MDAAGLHLFFQLILVAPYRGDAFTTFSTMRISFAMGTQGDLKTLPELRKPLYISQVLTCLEF